MKLFENPQKYSLGVVQKEFGLIQRNNFRFGLGCRLVFPIFLTLFLGLGLVFVSFFLVVSFVSFIIFYSFVYCPLLAIRRLRVVVPKCSPSFQTVNKFPNLLAGCDFFTFYLLLR